MTEIAVTPPSISKFSPLDAQNLLLFAVEELDVHISELICTGSFSISAKFHDWVADSLTTKIEAMLLTTQESSRFKDDLQQDDARTVVRHWVRQWVCMEIKQHFGQYVQFCPCTNSFIAHQMTVTTTAASSAQQWPSASEGLDT